MISHPLPHALSLGFRRFGVHPAQEDLLLLRGQQTDHHFVWKKVEQSAKKSIRSLPSVDPEVS